MKSNKDFVCHRNTEPGKTVLRFRVSMAKIMKEENKRE
jgi:hypothetical protein